MAPERPLHALRVAVTLIVAAIALSTAPGAMAAPAEGDAGAPAGATREPRVYVPIRQPVIEEAPAVPTRAARPPASGVRRAGQAVGATVTTVGVVSFMELPGTAIPMWWLLLVLPAVPLARMWRSWTARMFD